MEINELEELVDDMVLQLSYPGLDVRTLNLSLPSLANDAPVKLYVQALGSKSINVRIVALRWFQTRIGAAKHHQKSIAELFEDADPWIRKEAIKTIASTKSLDSKTILKICQLLKDDEHIVRIEAAKSLGNLGKEFSQSKASNKSADDVKTQVIDSLQEAAEDPILDVRRKAVKALRKMGAYSAS